MSPPRRAAAGLGSDGAELLVDLAERTTVAITKLAEVQSKSEEVMSGMQTILVQITPRVDAVLKELDGAGERTTVAVEAVKAHVSQTTRDAVSSMRWTFILGILILTIGELFQGAGLHWVSLMRGSP